MTTSGRHPGELAWARWLSGEYGGLAGWRFRRHLAACRSCRERDEALGRERTAFEASPRRHEQLSRLQRLAADRRAAAGSRWGPLAAGLAGAAAAMGLALFFLPARGPELLAKGRSDLRLYVEGPGGAAPLGERCREGDRLMARYRTARPYLLLLERDGQGRVQVLFPGEGARSARLPGGEGVTPSAWVLDAAPGRECFLALFSDEPMAADEVRRALPAGPAAAPAGTELVVRCCEKTVGR